MNIISEISTSLVLHNKNILNMQNEIGTLKTEFDSNSSLSKDDMKSLKGKINTLSNNLNTYVLNYQTTLGEKIISYLFELEKDKIDGKLPVIFYKDILYLYNVLSSECLRNHARYVKMPKDWILLGFMSGFLEDLVVVMRTLSQTKISSTQLVMLSDLIQNYRKYCEEDNSGRFPFITKLFSHDESLVREYIISSIKSQGRSRRIGMYTYSDSNEFYYSIQGLLGNMDYDKRVVRTLTEDNCPTFAVHFTKSDIAQKIWNKEKTTSVKGHRDLPVGTICRFQRSIHALTNISFDFDKKMYHIISSDKDIRTRMTHGIKDTDVRPKYESGLVIDLKKLIRTLPPGTVQINEIGTLLVNEDIPNSCILNLISTDEEIEFFWNA